MTTSQRRRDGGKRLQKKLTAQSGHGARLAALLLCLSMLAGLLPALASAEDDKEYLSSIVDFQSIALHYAGEDGRPAEPPIQTGLDGKTLLEKGRPLALNYTYAITEEQCGQIQAGKAYYLEVSPHLALPHLEAGSPLILQGETGPFGYIHADGSRAWVEFLADEVNGGLLLGSDGIQDADFYLDCTRADAVPKDELPIEGQRNLYAMTVEKREILRFGYAEDEPVTAKAQIDKTGAYQDKIITWTIDYTPWQNPGGDGDVALDTPFELQDTIRTGLHEYVKDSAAITIDGTAVAGITCYTSGDAVDRDQDAYVIVDTPEGGDTTLTFGGRIFNAVESTAGNPAVPLKITYQTEIKDELLLPGGAGGGKVTNAADLLAGKDGVFNSLHITAGSTVTVPQPVWLTKRGQTTRTPGSGSTTDWTVTFIPNGFTFGADEQLTLRNQLPEGSELDISSVAAEEGGKPIQGITVTPGEDNAFTVSGIETAGQTVEITYRTHVPEEMYDAGEDLGKNIAQFTFQYGEKDYHTLPVSTSVDSGNGTSGTAALLKSNTGYQPATRTIDWTVTINPHKADLKSGTFVDDLSAVGPQACKVNGHQHGLELDQTKGIEVLVDGAPVTDGSVAADYSEQEQKITVEAAGAGTRTITLNYTTKVCDPCIFAGNAKNSLTNTISTDNMSIGSQPSLQRSAASTANVNITVLTKKPPIYDYAAGLMRWTVEVDGAGVPMTDVVLTDDLPDGLSYKESTLAAHTADGRAIDAAAAVDGQRLTIRLDSVTEKTTVTFDTKVDPETLGFNSNEKTVVVENTIRMSGEADGVEFAEVSHSVRQNFSNHGLVKSSKVDNQREFIQYEVLINPYSLALPENPSLVDTLDRRLQLDPDTLLFYQVTLTGTTSNPGQTPGCTKPANGQPLKIADFDPAANRFTVQLPIHDGSRDAYVLTYTADIVDHQAGGYSNSVHFSGDSVLLGGDKNNSASVGGGGGGGGGGVAARKAVISIVKTDSETNKPISGVSFTLYQWDEATDTRGLPFAQGKTDAQGKLSFKVTPHAVYELAETESAPGYGSAFAVTNPPAGVTKTDGGLLITAGEAKSSLALELTNEAHTADIVFRLVNQSGVPMAGAEVRLFKENPAEKPDSEPVTVMVGADGTVRFSSARRGARYFIQRPDGEIMTVDVPAEENGLPKVTLADGTTEPLTEDYRAESAAEPEQQWQLTVTKVDSGSKNPLPGAKIQLYADEACRILIASGESAQDGTVTFSGLMKGQRYWLKETAAPDGYQLDAAVCKAAEDTPHITIENTPLPVNPGKPDIPENPDHSGGSGESDSPGEPDRPAGGPGEPDEPNKPGEPSEPGNPGEPDSPGDPGDSDTSKNTAGGSVATGSQSPPQTGDHAQVLMAVMLFSGITFTAMALYSLFELKKREKS